MIAVLSIDHHGKPHRIEDRGAIGHKGISEVDITSRYAWVAERELRKSGCKVVVVSSGRYLDRWLWADSIGADCYVACHANAGGGSRGEVYHDYRTRVEKGIDLSRNVAKGLDDRVPWHVEVKSAGQGDRAFKVIEGVQAAAIVYEPCFVDDPRGSVLEYCRAMGRGLAEGIITWAWTR